MFMKFMYNWKKIVNVWWIFASVFHELYENRTDYGKSYKLSTASMTLIVSFKNWVLINKRLAQNTTTYH